MKHSELESMFKHFIAKNKVKEGRSHFENGYGSKYITARPGTVQLKNADARCGRRATIALNLPNGCISPLLSYLPYNELYRVMQYSELNLKKKIKEYLTGFKPNK